MLLFDGREAAAWGQREAASQSASELWGLSPGGSKTLNEIAVPIVPTGMIRIAHYDYLWLRVSSVCATSKVPLERVRRRTGNLPCMSVSPDWLRAGLKPRCASLPQMVEAIGSADRCAEGEHGRLGPAPLWQ